MRLPWVQVEVRLNPVIERFLEMQMKGKYFLDPLEDLDPLDDLEDFLEMNEIFDDLFETVVSNFLNTCNTVC